MAVDHGGRVLSRTLSGGCGYELDYGEELRAGLHGGMSMSWMRQGEC